MESIMVIHVQNYGNLMFSRTYLFNNEKNLKFSFMVNKFAEKMIYSVENEMLHNLNVVRIIKRLMIIFFNKKLQLL